MTMGWDPWEPYQYQVSDEEVVGLDVEILTAVLEHAGCGIAFRKGQWTELLDQVRNGEINVVAGATLTPGREEFAWFTDEYRDEEFYLYVTASRLDTLGGQDFDSMMDAGLRIGVIEGYLYGEPVSDAQNDPAHENQFVYAPMSEVNVSRLVEGEIDGFIDDKYVGAAVIRRKNLSTEIAAHPQHFGRAGVRFMLSRASVSQAQYEAINEAVEALLASGKIQEILDQYLDQ
ncbi:MAG: transporter substrate-binding domain-containing protein [Xanthomonadales bacterium]|nr:transporter substrate-binding domain-containing protein [Xanthomonadales bacterium]